jgi:hypothetical protein
MQGNVLQEVSVFHSHPGAVSVCGDKEAPQVSRHVHRVSVDLMNDLSQTLQVRQVQLARIAHLHASILAHAQLSERNPDDLRRAFCGARGSPGACSSVTLWRF